MPNNIIRTYYSSTYLSPDFPFSIMRQEHTPEDFKEHRYGKREFWKICYVISGTAENIINDKCYRISPGSIYIAHPDDHTRYEISDPKLELYNLIFLPELIEDGLKTLRNDFAFFSIFSQEYNLENFQREPFYILAADREIEHIFRTLEREFDRRPHNFQMRIKFLLLDLLLLLARKGMLAFKRERKSKIINYIDYMMDCNFKEEFNLDFLAKKLEINKSHLCRIYHETTGKTVMEALRKRRIQEAIKELSGGKNRKISEVCINSGFKDLSSFYRNFQIETGKSPGDWRKENQSAAAAEK